LRQGNDSDIKAQLPRAPKSKEIGPKCRVADAQSPRWVFDRSNARLFTACSLTDQAIPFDDIVAKRHF